MSKRIARPDLLETGIYTIPEAAGLVDAPQASVRVWIEGHTGKQDAVIENQLGNAPERLPLSLLILWNCVSSQSLLVLALACVRSAG